MPPMQGSQLTMARWWAADKGQVWQYALAYVRTVDSVQAHMMNKFIRCAALYDMQPKPRIGNTGDLSMATDGRMHENAIASAVDTVSAQIATTDIRATFDTDDADWSEQRRARHREWYAEALSKLLDVAGKCQRAFKAGAATKGTGAIKVWIDGFDQIRVDNVLVDDIVVDELECRAMQSPRQLHIRTPVDRDELAAKYPDKADLIRVAQTGLTQFPRLWAGYRPLERNEIMMIESWRLPLGVKGRDRYKPGRHTICIDGCDLEDEEYDEPTFPVAVVFWERPTTGWYGIGLVERCAGLQRALNRRNLQIERQNDLQAFPTTWMHQSDAAMKNQALTVNAIGTIAFYKGPNPPRTEITNPVAPQTYEDADRLSAKIFENSGVSRMAAQAKKPAGVETGVALREYRDQTTQRFAMQEKAYEQLYLDVIVLILACCKKLGDKAPDVLRKTRFGRRTLSWAKVDMRDVRIQIGAASTLSRTRAGRLQAVVEWSQAGIISQDDAKRLLEHPDLERAMSLYNAAIENVEYVLEEIADGSTIMPEPFMNLKLLVWRAQQQYLNWQADGAPEDVLENLRTLIVQAAWMANPQQPPASASVGPDTSAPDQQGMPGGPPGMPGPPGVPPMMPPGAPGGPMPPMPPMPLMPPLPGGPPMPIPQAAFSPQAMQLG